MHYVLFLGWVCVGAIFVLRAGTRRGALFRVPAYLLISGAGVEAGSPPVVSAEVGEPGALQPSPVPLVREAANRYSIVTGGTPIKISFTVTGMMNSWVLSDVHADLARTPAGGR